MPFQTLISPEALRERLQSPETAHQTVVVDCRFKLDDPAYGRAAYAECHVSGAVYAHLDDDLSAPVVRGKTGRHPLPDPLVFAQTLGKWGIGAKTQVVAYDDQGGMYAARLWWMLQWMGHDHVAVLNGGWAAWLASGGATDAEMPRPSPKVFVPKVRGVMAVSAADVAAFIVQNQTAPGAVQLVDARALPRFLGETEPIDFVAGHIPTARCVFSMDNVRRAGFKAPEEIRQNFADVGVTGEAPVVVYCGSGVTAAHNALAMAVAGLPMPRLYAGSWSEWITDPNRPIATGIAV